MLEFNCRFGDPETQSILPRLEGDLLGALAAAAGGELAGVELTASDEAAVTVVLAAGGYPGALGHRLRRSTGSRRRRRPARSSSTPGTALQGDRLVTNGGRILNVTGTGETIAEARERAYAGCERDLVRRRPVPPRHRAGGAPGA